MYAVRIHTNLFFLCYKRGRAHRNLFWLLIFFSFFFWCVTYIYVWAFCDTFFGCHVRFCSFFFLNNSLTLRSRYFSFHFLNCCLCLSTFFAYIFVAVFIVSLLFLIFLMRKFLFGSVIIAYHIINCRKVQWWKKNYNRYSYSHSLSKLQTIAERNLKMDLMKLCKIE